MPQYQTADIGILAICAACLAVDDWSFLPTPDYHPKKLIRDIRHRHLVFV